MQNPKFKVSDIVTIKSGQNLKLTINKVKSKVTTRNTPVLRYGRTWFDVSLPPCSTEFMEEHIASPVPAKIRQPPIFFPRSFTGGSLVAYLLLPATVTGHNNAYSSKGSRPTKIIFTCRPMKPATMAAPDLSTFRKLTNLALQYTTFLPWCIL